MKKIISLALILCISLSIISVHVSAAENETVTNNAIYLYTEISNISKEISNSAVITADINSVRNEDVLNAPYIIVDFDTIKESTEILNYISTLINVGKILFLRAESHTANVSLIENMLGYSGADNGQLYETSSVALMERINTFGYIVYLDCNQRLQIVRQSADYISLNNGNISDEFIEADVTDFAVREAITSETEVSSELAYALLNSPKPSFDEELEAINDFLSYNSPTNVYNFTSQEYAIDVQSFDVGCNYERMISTETYYIEEGVAVGSITRRICASRLYPETTIKDGTPYPVATGNTKWAFQSVINMSPKWSTDKFANGRLYTSFTTYPVGPNNGTYKNIIMDYQPKVDTSGKTDVTYSIGPEISWGKEGTEAGISGGVSWVTSYDDITFTVDYAAGEYIDQNKASWNYTIGNGAEINIDLWFPKAVQKSTVELISAVRVDNVGHTSVGVQLNIQPTWAKSYVLYTRAYTGAMSSVVFILPVR